MRKSLFEALDQRFKITELYQEHLAGYMVPKPLNFWYSMGAVLIVLFTLQIISGILLLIFYISDVKSAFDSVQYITNQVPFGWLIRRVHAIGANMFILVLFFHMLSTLIMGSYKKPRETHWFIGCILFGIALAECLSGYLLPWSQLSYWATTVATSFPANLPLLGEWSVHFMRGGAKVTQFTLGRFFAVHVSLVPFLVFILIAAHLFVMRRTGISAPPGVDKDTCDKQPFFPHFAIEDLKIIFLFLAILFGFVFFYPQISLPPAALEPANPLITPEHIKPEWYFLANYQMLKLIPNALLGILAQMGMAGLIFFLPLIDRGEERRFFKRPIFATLVIASILGLVGLTIWGHFS